MVRALTYPVPDTSSQSAKPKGEGLEKNKEPRKEREKKGGTYFREPITGDTVACRARKQTRNTKYPIQGDVVKEV